MTRHTGKPRPNLRATQDGMKDRDEAATAEPSAPATEPRHRPQPDRSPREPRKPGFNRNNAPPGYDETVWHLALLFEQYAHADRIELRAGRPVIYAELMDLVVRYEMRGRDTIGSYPQEVHGCTRRGLPVSEASRCWYHYPPLDPDNQVARELTWQEMFEVVMAEFWSRVQNQHALDDFRQYFAEYARAALKHWRALRAIREIQSKPRAPRTIVQRRKPGATMSDASKEG